MPDPPPPTHHHNSEPGGVPVAANWCRATYHHDASRWRCGPRSPKVAKHAGKRAPVHSQLPPSKLGRTMQSKALCPPPHTHTQPVALLRTEPTIGVVNPKATCTNRQAPKKGHITAPGKLHVSSSSSGIVARRACTHARMPRPGVTVVPRHMHASNGDGPCSLGSLPQ